jgi:hypothetical protein
MHGLCQKRVRCAGILQSACYQLVAAARRRAWKSARASAVVVFAHKVVVFNTAVGSHAAKRFFGRISLTVPKDR